MTRRHDGHTLEPGALRTGWAAPDVAPRPPVDDALAQTYSTLAATLVADRTPEGCWVGELASSALATATAVIALATARERPADTRLVERGLRWLARHQNADGGWGDTTLSDSNISTTALCWAAWACAPEPMPESAAAIERCEGWLSRAAGGLSPDHLRHAIGARYGKDRTFAAPILTALALCGRLGSDGWRHVPQLPFELAACPPRWFQWLRLPVVSYALPALIAIGQVRHHRRPSRNLLLRGLRRRLSRATRTVLRRIQPSTGGYLEAAPLTSFVVMSLAGIGAADDRVAVEGLRFLRASVRADGSWPVDTNLSTWVTTLSLNALSHSGLDALSRADRDRLAAWLLAQQHALVHPYTQAAPGGWAWTPLAGGVPDADDTAGALLALHALGSDEGRVPAAAEAGTRWLLDLQNRDGGIPTFCRGWGALPFDRSTPDLTAHALRAWAAWRTRLSPALAAGVADASARALAYLATAQRADGAWLPLWFGNQRAEDDANPTYGTSRVLLALASPVRPLTGREVDMRDRGVAWMVASQNRDGGWGGDAGVESSIEETAFAVEALAHVSRAAPDALSGLAPCLERGAAWLVAATARGTMTPASPIGLYFAKLWYFERLYPLIFATGALGAALRARESGR